MERRFWRERFFHPELRNGMLLPELSDWELKEAYMRGNLKKDVDRIKRAINRGDILFIYEFINNNAEVNEVVNGYPLAFFEILSTAIVVDRHKLVFDNINEIYDDLILKLIGAAKAVHFGSLDEKTLLLLALEKRMSYKIIDGLIKAGSDVNARSSVESNHMSPLVQAVIAQNSIDIIVELINQGANINCQDGRGWTLLFYAMGFHNTDFIKMLLDAGLTVHDLDDGGKNILMTDICHCFDGNKCKMKESIRVLRQCGLSDGDLIRHTDKRGNNILHITDCVYTFDLAIKSGISVNSKNKMGQTPLAFIFCGDNVQPHYAKKLNYLLKSGADVNSTDPKLQTALHLCAKTVDNLIHPSTLDMLIYHGANIFARNIYNRTPLDMIIENNMYRIEELIFVIPMHIILFDDNGFDFEKESFEQPYDCERVSSFIVECKKELKLMRETFIADGLTFYEFCILKRYYKNTCVDIAPNKYKYMSKICVLFPIYQNLITIRIEDNRLKKRELDLRSSFEKIILRPVNAVEMDFHEGLNYDCLYYINRYLNYKEVFNVFSAAVDS